MVRNTGGMFGSNWGYLTLSPEKATTKSAKNTIITLSKVL